MAVLNLRSKINQLQRISIRFVVTSRETERSNQLRTNSRNSGEKERRIWTMRLGRKRQYHSALLPLEAEVEDLDNKALV